ncbi:MAG: endonuclease domain-containing protein [Acidobacteriota bacterium]
MERARQLRHAMTDAERVLWSALRDHSTGWKFRRQVPIGPYIVDFLCAAGALIVEIDGGQHADNAEDRRRDAWLRSRGYAVLRFWNAEALSNTAAVVATILRHLEERPRA